jgi:CheY-like chemotaxis protein
LNILNSTEVKNIAEIKVLVVEDNIIHMTLLIQQLTEGLSIPDLNITRATDGQDALKEIELNICENIADPL